MNISQIEQCAAAIDEVANVLEQLALSHSQVFDELKVRYPLADELGGFAAMLRDHAKVAEQQGAGQVLDSMYRALDRRHRIETIEGMPSAWISEMTQHYLENLVVLASAQPENGYFSGGPFTLADLHENVVIRAKGDCRNFAGGYIAEHIRAGSLTPEQCGRGLARVHCGLPGFADCGLSSELVQTFEKVCVPFGRAELRRATEEDALNYGMTLGVVYR